MRNRSAVSCATVAVIAGWWPALACGQACTVDADCEDGDGCTTHVCLDGICQECEHVAGDIDKNCVVNLFDVFCTLDAIGGDDHCSTCPNPFMMLPWEDSFDDGLYCGDWRADHVYGLTPPVIIERNGQMEVQIAKPSSECSMLRLYSRKKIPDVPFRIDFELTKLQHSGGTQLYVWSDENNYFRVGVDSSDVCYGIVMNRAFGSQAEFRFDTCNDFIGPTPFVITIERTADSFEVYVDGVQKGSLFTNSGIDFTNARIIIESGVCLWKQESAHDIAHHIQVVEQ